MPDRSSVGLARRIVQAVEALISFVTRPAVLAVLLRIGGVLVALGLAALLLLAMGVSPLEATKLILSGAWGWPNNPAAALSKLALSLIHI